MLDASIITTMYNTYQIYRWSIVHTNLIMDTHTCIIQWLIKLFPYEAPVSYQLAV